MVDKRPRQVSKELSDSEQRLRQVFLQHGPVLSYSEAKRRCEEAGLNPTTTSIYLGNSPVVRRVATGIYTLIGSTIIPGEVEIAAKAEALKRRRVQQGYGWSSDGKSMWVDYKLSPGLLRGGVASLPPAVAKCLNVDGYPLQDPDGSDLGRLGSGNGTTWGLLPLFRRRGGESGDYLRLEFDLQRQVATAVLSEEPFESEP